MAELDDLSVHSARLVPDVLPFPAGDVALSQDRLRAASCPRIRAARGGPGGAGAGNGCGGRCAGAVAMSVLAHPGKPAPARLHIIELSHTVRAELLFALLLALMASGMPISIALGLSVLTYLFILSDVDPKMVGLKLFTSLDRFEIMAIPFFILAGN